MIVDCVGIEQARGVACLVCGRSQLHGPRTTQLSWNALSNNYVGLAPRYCPKQPPSVRFSGSLATGVVRNLRRLDLCTSLLFVSTYQWGQRWTSSLGTTDRVRFTAAGNSRSIDSINLFGPKINSGSWGGRLSSSVPENKFVLLVSPGSGEFIFAAG